MAKSEPNPMPVIALLSGGLATRMRPATLLTAKSMLPVAGEPFLGHQLRMLAGQGFRDVVLCCGHLAEQLEAYAGDGRTWGLRLRYSGDGAAPLGTGGALKKALPMLGRRFMVMYGDSWLPTEFRPVWEAFLRCGLEGMMTVYPNENRWDGSNAHFEDGWLVDYSKTAKTAKMRHIDYGLSCLEARALTEWPDGARFDLAEVAAELLKRGELAGFEVRERFYEIGSPAGLAETDALLRAEARA